ncbi:MAG: DUF2851 family protein [Muribaculaceae bacterium]|nr:DUF2851 family protein [Muribaculaceae bacterium]
MEELYHYLWKTGIHGSDFKDVDGSEIEVIDPGIHNLDSGPDFFNSKLKINGVEWIGNVEIHIKASDWYKHGHDKDPAYDNVILHVVAVSDRRVARCDGTNIPQLIFTMPDKFYRTLSTLSEDIENVKCASMLSTVPELNKTDWLESLSIERMQQKALRVKNNLEAGNGDWEQTCFITLARGFGFGLNGDPFELLAKSIPLRILHHHSDNPFQLEAILFGNSGMLDATSHLFDDYFQGLCREYYFLARKYNLKPLRQGLWKYSRTRPQNFPHRRIAFLANSALGGFSLFSKMLESAKDAETMINLFDFKAEGYWENHYSFGSDPVNVAFELSRASKILLCINVGVPLLYSYASTIGNLELAERALSIMEELPAEKNSIISQWNVLGLEAKNASGSQALIHLRKEFCEKNKCMFCRFGHHYLRKSVN